MTVYKCIIVEDEPLAQNVLKKYIAEHPALELAAVCGNAMEAQAALNKEHIPLLFLDINLPKISGIHFLKTLPHAPLVIFTTAYPAFAVEGFELDAVDYLLKPFSFERFLKAVNRAMEKLQRPAANSMAADAFIFLKADKKVYKIDLDSILYIEATGDYLKVLTTHQHLLVHNTLKNLLEELPADNFLRVHKSYIIAKNKIVYLEGNYIRIADTDIPIGASYKEVLNILKARN
jgi:DNA-binding LytR/AlgR family response regulator